MGFEESIVGLIAENVEVNLELECVADTVQNLNSSLTDVNVRVMDLDIRVEQLEVSGNMGI